MTVSELIAQLQALPDQSLRVIVNGYEGGYHDVVALLNRPIDLNVNKEWYYGPHDDPRGDKPDEVAVLISYSPD